EPFQPGELLEGRFRIVREVAQGGMGIVYEATDEKLDRRVAVKCAKAGFRRRLPPEVRNATEISHPNVCKIFEIHTASTPHGEIDFLTMEFLEGQTLAERLRGGPLPESEARSIALQLCAGLAEAHRKRVIHGDLKSNNVLLTTSADGGIQAVITDFGLARRPGASQPGMASDVGGNPDYMAPELWRGEKPSVASDVYALGVILYELASGRRPFAGDIPMARKPPATHTKWDRVLARCLDPDASRRYSDVGEVARALGPSQTRRWLLAAAAAVVVSAATGVVTHQRATTPSESLRLAVLPFEASPDIKPLCDGLLEDTCDRLSRVKRGRIMLTVIPLSEAIRNGVDRQEKAVKVLGATHTLTGTMRRENGRTIVQAQLTDARSRLQLNPWRAAYQASELRNMPIALAGMVTGTLRLPPLTLTATVNSAAYADFATGVSQTRRNTGVDSALPLLERAVAADPDSPLTHARLAEAQLLKYRLTSDPAWRDRAMRSLRLAEQRNPDLALVRLVSGMLNQYSGLYERAQADLQRALDIEPANGDVWRRLGQIYKDNNHFKEALAAFQKAIEVQPDYFKNYQDLCSLHSDQANYEEAIRQCQKMVELAPDLSDAHFALALPYLNRGSYAQGEYELRVAIRLQENSSKAHHNLGVALLYQDRNLEAIPSFKRALEIGPAMHLQYLNLGTSFRRANLPGEAREAYRKGLALAEAELARNPREGALRSGLAYLCARLGNRDRAKSEAAQAEQLAVGSVNVGWMLVLTYEALGERDRALALIEDLPDDTLRRLNRFPDLADLRADSRFQQVLVSRHIQ
ncbi:MAG: protein kinase domain-containing protein, partial [Bryobacteraceae bacterium]